MGTALYVRLMVYAGLSLFIIMWANVYLVVCVLTRITLHDPNKMVKHVLQEYVKRKISELQLIHQRNRIRRSEMEALAEITRESKGKSVNLFRNEYFQYVTQQKIPFPSQLY